MMTDKKSSWRNFEKGRIEKFLKNLKSFLISRLKNEVEGQILIQLHPILQRVPLIVQLVVTLTTASVLMILYLLVMSIVFFEEPVMYNHLLYGSGGSLLLGLIVGALVAGRIRSKINQRYYQNMRDAHSGWEEWFKKD